MQQDTSAPITHFHLVQASTVKSKRTKWIVDNMIPWNGLTLLGGREGVGKSTVACAWVAAATLGNLDNHEPLNVLYLHTEDSREATIVPRLRAADADLERVYFLDIQLEYQLDEDGEKEVIDRQLTLPADFPKLRQAIADYNIGMIVLDAAKSAMSSNIDGNKDESVRRMLDPMNRIADELGCVFLALVHFGKRESADTGKLITGSIAWSQVARSVIAVAKDEEGKLLVATTKHNLAPHDVTLEAHIESADVLIEGEDVPVGRIVWDGVSSRSVSDLLAPDNGADDMDRTDCEIWVQDFLEGKANVPRQVVLAEAAKAGFKVSKTVQRAFNKLGGKSDYTKTKPRTALWTLPSGDTSRDHTLRRVPTVPTGADQGKYNVPTRTKTQLGHRDMRSQESVPTVIPFPIDSIDSHAREQESMTPMQESMDVPPHDSVAFRETLLSALSAEHGLSRHIIIGCFPKKLNPEAHLDTELAHLEDQGLVTRDRKGNFLLTGATTQ